MSKYIVKVKYQLLLDRLPLDNQPWYKIEKPFDTLVEAFCAMNKDHRMHFRDIAWHHGFFFTIGSAEILSNQNVMLCRKYAIEKNAAIKFSAGTYLHINTAAIAVKEFEKQAAFDLSDYAAKKSYGALYLLATKTSLQMIEVDGNRYKPRLKKYKKEIQYPLFKGVPLHR